MLKLKFCQVIKKLFDQEYRTNRFFLQVKGSNLTNKVTIATSLRSMIEVSSQSEVYHFAIITFLTATLPSEKTVFNKYRPGS